MNSIGCSVLSAICSIDLYAINLKEENVPERSTKVSGMNYHVRRLISARLSLQEISSNPRAEPTRGVSSHPMKQLQIFDLLGSYPAAEVM
jgi:hypothetical protein